MSAERVAAAAFEFLVGDDWRTAVGVAGLLAATALLAAAGLPAWPLTVVATVAVLLWSVKRRASGIAATQRRRSPAATAGGATVTPRAVE